MSPVCGLSTYVNASYDISVVRQHGSLGVGRHYIAELRGVWPDVSQPLAKGSAELARVVELVGSFRQLLSIFLAEATDTARCSCCSGL